MSAVLSCNILGRKPETGLIDVEKSFDLDHETIATVHLATTADLIETTQQVISPSYRSPLTIFCTNVLSLVASDWAKK